MSDPFSLGLGHPPNDQRWSGFLICLEKDQCRSYLFFPFFFFLALSDYFSLWYFKVVLIIILCAML